MAESAKEKRYLADYITLVLLIVIIAVLLVFMLSNYHLNDEVGFEPELSVMDNPLMGYAPSADNADLCEDSNLVFIKLRWKDWEPEKDQYNIDYLESKYNVSRWKYEGKHAVLRFVCDEPGKSSHTDIPDWLLSETGDGVRYSSEYGSGYSPNYENKLFIERHAKAIAALADYFNEDMFLSYVELGSLGHWGEWHARDDDGNSLMPSSETCWDYILAYTTEFHNTMFLMRRSYSYAREAQLGLFNDVVGDKTETERWLEWIRAGGVQDTVSDQIVISQYENFWKAAPVGGEITSGISPETLFNEKLSELLGQIEESHMTFIGPNIPDREEYTSAYEAVLRRLGYRYYVSRLSTTVSFSDDTLILQMDWQNAGSAPLYRDWPVIVRIYDESGNEVYWETLDLKLSELHPGKIFTTETRVPMTDGIREGLSIGITVYSYDESEQLKLAMDTELGFIGDSQIIYTTMTN